MRDFTISKYKELIIHLKRTNYTFLNIKDALIHPNLYSDMKLAIIRHDIDTKYDLPIALEMATFESEQGISATYYFRTLPAIYDEVIIKKIFELRHEIGYHYEVMSLMHGNPEKSIELFQNDLKEMRLTCPVTTICQHGGAMGHYETTSFKGIFKIGIGMLLGKIKIKYNPSINLWDKYDFRDFGIMGDAYLSLDHNKIKYFSDTGMRWDGEKVRMADKVIEGENADIKAHSTDDLINLITRDKLNTINILVHPANWNESFSKWLKWKIIQKFRNLVKRIYKIFDSNR